MKEINEKEFDEVLKNEKVLVDFNATWCGPCRMLKPILEETSSEVKTEIVSIDVDKNENLAREYHISSIPCLILFNNGKEEKRSIGLISKSELKEFIGE